MCTKCDPIDTEEKYCSGCNNYKLLALDFSGNKAQKDEHCNWCKVCDKSKRDLYNKTNRDRLRQWQLEYDTANAEKRSAAKSAYYQANKGKVLARNKSWKKNNPFQARRTTTVRRARKNEVERDRSITAASWTALKVLYGNRCLNPECIDPTAKLTMDHVIPISKGGADTIWNLQPLCQSCNSSKHTKVIDYRSTQLMVLPPRLVDSVGA